MRILVRGARRQRRAARPAGGRDAATTSRRSSARAQARGIARAARRDGGAAQLRRGLHQRVPRRLPRPRATHKTWPSCRSISTAWRETRAQHRRRHPSEPGGRRHRRADNLAGSRTAPAAAAASPAGTSMIELRGVSKTVQSGGPPAHHSASTRLLDRVRRIRRHRGPVGQRQVHAARAARRPRRAVHRARSSSTASTSPASARTGWRSCAARRSGSCSSSSTWCRR